jgi:hypothetical protein
MQQSLHTLIKQAEELPRIAGKGKFLLFLTEKEYSLHIFFLALENYWVTLYDNENSHSNHILPEIQVFL